MSILNVKDSQGMEVTRFLTVTDEAYYGIMNRPLEDVEQRTNDLHSMMAPGRGFRVVETVSPSASVRVLEGYYLKDDDKTPARFPDPTDSRPDSVVIPVAAAAQFRVDLITLDPHAAIEPLIRVQGSTEANFPTAWTNRARVPANSSQYPLAYVYVDDSSATTYQNSILVDNAGHIRDARLSYGAGGRQYEDDTTQVLSDSASFTAGTSTLAARADHAHPTNIDGTIPTTIEPDGTQDTGSASTYAKSDHKHGVPLETVATNVLSDTIGGSLGVANLCLPADHQHELNVQNAIPQPSQTGVPGSAGTSNFYSRLDHVHHVENVKIHSVDFSVNWTNSAGSASASISPITFPYPNWLWMWIIFTGHNTFDAPNGGAEPAGRHGQMGQGFGVYAPGVSSASSVYMSNGISPEDWRSSLEVGGLSNSVVAGVPNVDNLGDITPDYTNRGFTYQFSRDAAAFGGWTMQVTNFAPNLITFDPTVIIFAELQGILFAQET